MQEFRAELEAAETKDKKFTKRKTVLKKIVANITMGNDSESVSVMDGAHAYGIGLGQCRLCSPTSCRASGHRCSRLRRVRAFDCAWGLSGSHSHRRTQWCTSSSCATAVRRPTSCTWSSQAFYRYVVLARCSLHGIVDNVQDCNDRNPLVRALAIRTMSYIPTPIVIEALTEQLRHCLKDRDPYVRKTAAICVAKLYTADPRKAEKGGFVEMLRDLLLDSNATVVANAVAALSEIGDRQDGVIFKLNLTVANKLLTALGESSEYVFSWLASNCCNTLNRVR